MWYLWNGRIKNLWCTKYLEHNHLQCGTSPNLQLLPSLRVCDALLECAYEKHTAKSDGYFYRDGAKEWWGVGMMDELNELPRMSDVVTT